MKVLGEKHNLDEADKHGFPINKNGEQVSLFDKNGNAVLLLNNTILVKFPKGYAIKFNPNSKLEVRSAVDTLVNILADKFDENIKGSIEVDLSDEVKIKNNVFTKEPLIIPTVQFYFSWINGWLNYLGNCYNIEFKILFYAKYKERIKNNLIALKTGLNNHHIEQKYLEFVVSWFKETDKNIELEKNTVKKTQSQEETLSAEQTKKSKPEPKETDSNEYLEIFRTKHIFKDDLSAEIQSLYNRTKNKWFDHTTLENFMLTFTTTEPKEKLNWIIGTLADFGWFLFYLEKTIHSDKISSFNNWAERRFKFKNKDKTTKDIGRIKSKRKEANRTANEKENIKNLINTLKDPKITPKITHRTGLNH